MNELPKEHRDMLNQAYARALDRHLKYIEQQQAKQANIVQDCQPQNPR